MAEQDRNTLSEYLSERGYVLVAPSCPECGFGQLVRRDYEGGRIMCTAYGQCENAPG